ncbi:MAG: hypothetical protein F4Y02_00545 [Chloroflexi bacterium]|nr:hypothetical protein [Chloroflexota bacterium]
MLRAAIDDLDTMQPHGPANGGFQGTYTHPGVVWALRTVSPLWRGVWNIDEGSGPRPATACAPGEVASTCRRDLHKAIVLVADGANWFGRMPRRQSEASPAGNPRMTNDPFALCYRDVSPNYLAAAAAGNGTDFNAHFASYTTSTGTFDTAQMEPVLDAFHKYGDSLSDTAARRSLRQLVLKNATPWGIFRGVDATGSLDGLLDDDNEFGFTGRPVQVHHMCGRSSLFGPYGRVDDAIRVGHSSGVLPKLLEPVLGEAPFAVDFSVSAATPSGEADKIIARFETRLDGWLRDACELAGQRRVRISAIYIGDAAEGSSERTLLGDCVALAGGDRERDVYVTPTARELRDTFADIFTVRRNLRFLE